MSKTKSKKKLNVEYVKSMIGSSRRQRGTLRALGLKRLGDVVEVEDNDVMRGMLRKVEHLVVVQEVK
jgi:large subunit ribosomal protein L30